MVTWATGSAVVGYVYQRIGRCEWLGLGGALVSDAADARVACSPVEARVWLAEVVDDPTVWVLVKRVEACAICGQ